MKKLLLVALISTISSCGGIGGGGGGGGSSANYAGNVYLELERDYLDSGDLSRVKIEINDLNPDGAILKIRTSRSLRYNPNSGLLFPDRDEQRRVSPSEESTSDTDRFVVFFLYPRNAIDEHFISLQFDIKAATGDEEAFLEVDLDNNDPNIPDSLEFRSNDPRFSALERREIYIEPEDGEPEATPTPAATGSPTATPAS